MPTGIAIVKYYDCPSNPRQANDNLGVAYIFDRRISHVADPHDFSDRAAFEEHQASLPLRHKDKMLEQCRHNIYCYEHGGITLSLRPATPAGSSVGVMYTTRRRIRSYACASTPPPPRQAAVCIRLGLCPQVIPNKHFGNQSREQQQRRHRRLTRPAHFLTPATPPETMCIIITIRHRQPPQPKHKGRRCYNPAALPSCAPAPPQPRKHTQRCRQQLLLSASPPAKPIRSSRPYA